MSRIGKSPTRLLVATLAVLTVMLAAETVALAAGTFRASGGPIKAIYTNNTNDYVDLKSTTLADVPNMSVTVSVPSGQTALFVITFSAASSCTHGGTISAWCTVEAFVDTSGQGPVGTTFDSSDGSWDTEEAHSMQWVSGPMGPGLHRVRIRYRVGPTDGGTTFTLGPRTLTVLRSKL